MALRAIVFGRVNPALSAALLSVAIAACTSSVSGSNETVQIVSVATGTTSVACGGPTPSPDSIAWDLRVVNTTDHDVSIERIGSSGFIIRASSELLVGTAIGQIDELPFTPKPTMLVARDGNRVVRAMLPTRPLCQQAPTAWKDLYISLRVSTDERQLVTEWVTIVIR